VSATTDSFKRVREDVLVAHAAESSWAEASLVEAVEKKLAVLVRGINKGVADFDALANDLDRRRDPARITVDLLGSLARERDEVLHTRAIGTLLALRTPLGDGLFRALTEKLGLSFAPDDLASIGERAVHAERRILVGKKSRQLDLLITFGATAVIIENKIDTEDHERQLDDYAAWAASTHPRHALIYLTVAGDQPTRAPASLKVWRTMSYIDLLVAWRGVLRTQEGTPGPHLELLRLYLATLARKICALKPPAAGMLRADKIRAMDYLRAAIGDSGETS
jgi:hypothetical protein